MEKIINKELNDGYAIVVNAPEHGMKVKLHVIQGENTIHADTINLNAAKSRTAVINALEKKGIQINDEILLKIMKEIECWQHEEMLRPKESILKEKAPFVPTQENIKRAKSILTYGMPLSFILGELKKIVADEDKNCLKLYLIATSRLLPEPISAIIKGPSGLGKSHLVKSVIKLIPADQQQSISRITPKTLEYIPSGYFNDNVVFIDEIIGADDANYPIRILISEGRLILFTNYLDPKTGKRLPQEIISIQSASFITTTIYSSIDEERETRCFSLHINTSDEHIRNTLYKIAEKAQTEYEFSLPQTIQHLLEKRNVSIPYMPAIVDILSDEKRIIDPRDFARLIALIESSAIIHQKQRLTLSYGETNVIIASFADYEIARLLWLEYPAQTAEFIKKAKKDGPYPLTRAWIQESMGFNESQMETFVKQLEHKVLKVLQGSQGVEYQYDLYEDILPKTDKLITAFEKRFNDETKIFPASSELREKYKGGISQLIDELTKNMYNPLTGKLIKGGYDPARSSEVDDDWFV